MATVAERYRQLLADVGGNYGEAYNKASEARGLSTDPSDVLLERYAQGAENPLNAAVAPVYEGLKYVEQNTPVPALSKTIDLLGLPQGWKPGAGTSPASWSNIGAAGAGAKDRFIRALFGD